MATCRQETPFRTLELPDEFEDLTGLLQSDLKAIVAAADAAGQRATAADPSRDPPAPPDPLEQPDAGRQRGGRAALGRSPLIGSTVAPSVRRSRSSATDRAGCATRSSDRRRRSQSTLRSTPGRLAVDVESPMARIILGVTGSVAAVRTPALYATLRGAGHAVRVVATEPALYFFDPAELGPRRPRTRAGRSTATPTSGPGARYRRGDPGPAHRVSPVGRPADRRPARRQHPGEVRPRPVRQLPDLPVPRLGFLPAGGARPRDEHADVAEPGDAAAPPPVARRPRRRPAGRAAAWTLDDAAEVFARHAPAWCWSPPGEAAGLRRRRRRRHGRGRHPGRDRPQWANLAAEDPATTLRCSALPPWNGPFVRPEIGPRCRGGSSASAGI